MKSLFIVLLVTVFLFEGTGQEIIKKIPFKGDVREIEVVAFQDSLFLNFTSNAGELKSFLLLPGDKVVPTLNIHNLNKHPMCGMVPLPGNVKRFYLVDQRRDNFTLAAIEFDFNKLKATGLKGEWTGVGKFLHVEADEGRAIVYSYEKDTNTLRETIFDGLLVFRQTKYVLSFDFGEFSERDMTIISESDFQMAVQVKADVKLFLSKNEIAAVFDKPSYIKGKGKTMVSRFNRTSGTVVSTIEISEESKGKFSTTIYDGRFYRILTLKDHFELQVFDGQTGKESYRKKIYTVARPNDRWVYFRTGRADKISKSENLGHMMKVSNMCDPFIVVRPTKTDGELEVTMGTYYNDNGAMAPVGIGLNPAAAIVSMVVGTTVLQLMNGPGISRYFYLQGNPTNGFYFSESPTGLRHAIDSFEMNQREEVGKLETRGYFQDEGAIIVCYYVVKLDSLILVRYQ